MSREAYGRDSGRKRRWDDAAEWDREAGSPQRKRRRQDEGPRGHDHHRRDRESDRYGRREEKSDRDRFRDFDRHRRSGSHRDRERGRREHGRDHERRDRDHRDVRASPPRRSPPRQAAPQAVSAEELARRKAEEEKRREEEKAKENIELDAEMQKRRERIAAWRAANKKKKEDEEQEQESEGQEKNSWSLDNDADDTGAPQSATGDGDEEKAAKAEGEAKGGEEAGGDAMDTSEEAKKGGEGGGSAADGVDPLDMFMSGLLGATAKKKSSGMSGKTKVDVVKGTKKKVDKFAVAMLDPMRTKRTTGDLYFDDEDTDEFMVEEDEVWKAKTRKRELAVVDHSTVDYAEIRKKFYIEVPEITNMTDEEVESYREELGNIKIHGRKCPRPIRNFYQCGLSQRVLSVCQKAGYEKPTPIQAQAIPACMSGRDLIGIAKTGSGKTLAFLLPMLRHMLDQPLPEPGEGPIGLIMAPTRELAVQLHLEANKFCKKLGTRSVCVYGGAGISSQIGDLKRGAAIVVCTPGRMIDILCTNAGRITNLRRVSFIVLDEADRMFDMGFEPQIMRIIANVRPDKQMVMFSATFPKSVEVAARRILKRPLEIIVGGISVVCGDVEQVVEVREDESKYSRLLQLLGEWCTKGNVLVFVNQQEECDKLFQKLLKSGYPCDSLHGGKDQADRSSTIADFKAGTTTILVATSVAARGLDVPILRLVVNYSSPNHYEDYVHRCGRTGRAGRKGTAVTFITPEEEIYAPDLVKALKNSQVDVPAELMALASSYLTKLESGAAKIHGSGFGGSGYRFDDKEADEKKAADQQQRRAFLTGEEEGEAEVEALPLVESEAAKAAVAAAKAAKEGLPAPGIVPGVAPTVELTVIDPTQEEVPTTTALASIQLSEMTGKYETELEINDYPQAARWKVTRKDALTSVIEFTNCAITCKGSFFPPGRKAPEGERKLHLLIEGEDEFSVRYARKEILRELSEAASKAAPDKDQYGKYSVL